MQRNHIVWMTRSIEFLLCRNNQYIDKKSPEGLQARVTFVDEHPPAGSCYDYVRVTQQDDEIAWSSPVWFGGETNQKNDDHARETEHDHGDNNTDRGRAEQL